jgi:hypothetical protein
MWPFKPASPPPVPQKLREMLKEYPELIERLQESLNKVITDPVKSEPPFEVAIWRLEGALDSFVDEALVELDAARASGDAAAIGKADAKRRLMLFAGSSGGGMHDLSELHAYFQAHWGP